MRYWWAHVREVLVLGTILAVMEIMDWWDRRRRRK